MGSLTKAQAAGHLAFVVKLMGDRAGDDDIDEWRLFLAHIAEGLDRKRGPMLAEMIAFGEEDALETKLRRLIDHRNTPGPERDAAEAALARIRETR